MEEPFAFQTWATIAIYRRNAQLFLLQFLLYHLALIGH